LKAIELRHQQIAEHKVDFYARLLEHSQCFYAIARSQNAISGLLDLSRYDVANTVVIVDHQHCERE
jgi:hypothetical protein